MGLGGHSGGQAKRMLISVGRIVVAAVGAVLLAVVAVFVVRSVAWIPTSSLAPIKSTPALPIMTTTAVESTVAARDPGSNPDANADQNTTEPSTTEPSMTEPTRTEPSASEHYTATSKKIQQIDGAVGVDVDLPQVQGGKPDVAQSFNDRMQSALQAQIDSLSEGTLESRAGSGVRVGERVLSGLLRTVATDKQTANAVAMASTVVVDTDGGGRITLADLFEDLDTGLERLCELSEELGPSTSVGSDFDDSQLEPTEKFFERWTAEIAGMRVYFDQGLVAPEEAGVVDVTIPWEELEDVLKPGIAHIVTS
jgi:hypothetical protein